VRTYLFSFLLFFSFLIVLAQEEEDTAVLPNAKDGPPLESTFHSLMAVLDGLDGELSLIELWPEGCKETIRPLTDECHEIKEENRALEQQWRNYGRLVVEMDRLLQGLNIASGLLNMVHNPTGGSATCQGPPGSGGREDHQ